MKQNAKISLTKITVYDHVVNYPYLSLKLCNGKVNSLMKVIVVSPHLFFPCCMYKVFSVSL